MPVDSEHSALAQCLRGGRAEEVTGWSLTASGGPFRGRTRGEMADVTPATGAGAPDLGHGPGGHHQLGDPGEQGPGGDRGAPVVRRPVRRIEVVVHPQSIVHSMVEFIDGSTLAQAWPPDMRLPIALALGWPDRVAGRRPGLRLDQGRHLGVLPAGQEAFPAVRLAKQVGQPAGRPGRLQRGQRGVRGAFLAGRLPLPGDRGYHRSGWSPSTPIGDLRTSATLEAVLAADSGARTRARGPSRLKDIVAVTGTAGASADDDRWKVGPLGLGILFVVALVASIMLHEAGHMVCARKRSAARSPSSSSGSGRRSGPSARARPSTASRRIPAGGYVKIVGMTDLEHDRDRRTSRGPSTTKPLGWRLLTLRAGSLVALPRSPWCCSDGPAHWGIASRDLSGTVGDGHAVA